MDLTSSDDEEDNTTEPVNTASALRFFNTKIKELEQEKITLQQRVLVIEEKISTFKKLSAWASGDISSRHGEEVNPSTAATSLSSPIQTDPVNAIEGIVPDLVEQVDATMKATECHDTATDVEKADDDQVDQSSVDPYLVPVEFSSAEGGFTPTFPELAVVTTPTIPIIPKIPISRDDSPSAVDVTTDGRTIPNA